MDAIIQCHCEPPLSLAPPARAGVFFGGVAISLNLQTVVGW
ncbi:MAG TPA: hypothetical protein VJ022_04575 [Anaerolineales bacterium]|nr:hypothetical protein [Anaerolineales bacterium]